MTRSVLGGCGPSSLHLSPPPPSSRVSSLAAELSQDTHQLRSSDERRRPPAASPRRSIARDGAFRKQSSAKKIPDMELNIDVPGMREEHQLHGMGSFYQLFMHHLEESPLCLPTCPEYKTRTPYADQVWVVRAQL